MSCQKWFLLSVVVLVACSALVPEDAAAVPAFARRYKISCTTCHAPFPKLKAYGEEFAGNGFIIPEEEKDRDYVIAGDDLLRLNKVFQLGVRLDVYGVYDDSGDVETDLQTPWGLKVMSGGALARNVGYYFYFYLTERGEVAGIEDAIIHFDNLFGSNLDVAVGQFQTSDPLMKRELRLTFEDYLIYKAKIGDSNTNLTYDRGVMLSYGIERTGTDIIGLIVNGNGKDEAGEDKVFDDDRFKNVGLKIAQAVGENLTVGGFVYVGKEKQIPAAPEAKASPSENEITYWGPDLNLSVGPLEFTGQYLVREDSNPDFVEEASKIETSGIVAELIFAPDEDRSRHYITLLYNQIDSDSDEHDYESLTASGTYLLARNLRLMVEYTRDLDNDRNRVVVGTVAGF